MTTNHSSEKGDRNPYEGLYSKVRRIYIPLPGFKFFHRPSEVDDVDSQFVGRERILELLINWLEDRKGNRTGSYLITGYRGMGKTSFVSKAIDELIKEQKQKQHPKLSLAKNPKSIWAKCYPFVIGFLMMIPSLVLFFSLILNCTLSVKARYSILAYCVLFIAVAIIWQIKYLKESYIIKVKVNIGNEVSETKDVLSLLASSIRNRFREYIEETVPILPSIIIVRLVFWTALSYSVYAFFQNFMDIVGPAGTAFLSTKNDSFILETIRFINDMLLQLTHEYPHFAIVLGLFVVLPIAYYLLSRLMRVLFRLSDYFGKSFVRPTQIMNQLDELCNRIDASVKEDNDPYDVKVSAFSLIMKHRSSKHYQPASVREIEQSLIEIIEQIDESFILHCRLIVILDEMDKLNKSDRSEETRSQEFPEYASNENGVSDEVTQNEKRHRILSLLGQMKYFISTAKAKFIFIAGHELYDAYLADVSDREYSISSIFNGVINVDSFFTCNSRVKDITKLTEAYVCKHLMDDNDSVKSPDNNGQSKWESDSEKYNLRKYWEYIEARKPAESNLEKREREKIFTFLRQFVTYLTFVSNGAPKKLTSHFEKYIISRVVFKKQNPNDDRIPEAMVLNGPTEADESDAADYYLAFGYYDQQKIGFIHYMAYPIFENIISPSSEYGDKLLISSSFLIAHIYKHHTSGFSWRNLEYLPELIDSSRTPELREYINSIIGYLTKIHLTSITSGIYTYKFPLRLVEEISIFTKKSEELSAIFNFSLDYSLAVKKYYYRMLEFYRTKQRGAEVIKASLHHNLGDIHMSNDEYTEAIVQFRLTADSIETQMRTLRSIDVNENLSSLIVRYTRVMLKLGLAYEKRNTMDSAYLVYSNLTTKLISHREIEEHSLNLEYKIATDTSENKYLQGKRVILYRPEDECSIDPFHRTCYPNPYDNDEDQQVKYWIYGDQLTDNLCDFLSSTKELLITKLSVFEDLRVAYLPVLAKLFALEKHNICGITRDNIKVAEAEFKYMFLLTNSKDKYLLHVDFYRKLGDILYYKNRYFYENERDTVMALFACWGYDIKSALFDFCFQEKIAKERIEPIMAILSEPKNYDGITDWSVFKNKVVAGSNLYSEMLIRRFLNQIPDGYTSRIGSILECGCRRKKLSNTPCFACRNYNRSLSLLKEMLVKRYLSSENFPNHVSKAFLFLYVIESDEDRILFRYNELTQIALTLDSMGDALLSCSSKSDRIGRGFITSLLRSNLLLLREYENRISHLEKVLLYYWTAMKYHNKASNRKEGVQCLLKILKVLHSDASAHQQRGGFLPVLSPIRKCVTEAVQAIYATRDFYNIRETKKLNKIIGGFVNLGLTSIMPEVEELLMAYYEIVLNQLSVSHKEDYRKLLNVLYTSPSMSYLRNDSLIYNKVISLLFKATLNERVFLEMGYNLKSPPTKQAAGNLDVSSGISPVEVNWEDLFETGNVDRQKAAEIRETIAACLGKKRTIRDAFEFLVADSIFCLTNITDYILPTIRTSLFTNSFCQSVYMRLYYWVRWKEAYVEAYAATFGKSEIPLEKSINQLVEVHKSETLKPTFLREMANKHTAAAKEMHSEGDEYQDFIKGFYLLDDDLQNNTCQFYFALERYKINSDGLEVLPEEKNKETYYDPEQFYLWPDKQKGSA